MNKKTKIEKPNTFSLQLGNELVSFKETKLPIENIYTEVGITDWEIHLNKTMFLLENDTKQEIKKYDPDVKKQMDHDKLKNIQQYSGYWFA